MVSPESFLEKGCLCLSGSLAFALLQGTIFVLVLSPCGGLFSTLDKQRICVNTQLKSSKKQLK